MAFTKGNGYSLLALCGIGAVATAFVGVTRVTKSINGDEFEAVRVLVYALAAGAVAPLLGVGTSWWAESCPCCPSRCFRIFLVTIISLFSLFCLLVSLMVYDDRDTFQGITSRLQDRCTTDDCNAAMLLMLISLSVATTVSFITLAMTTRSKDNMSATRTAGTRYHV